MGYVLVAILIFSILFYICYKIFKSKKDKTKEYKNSQKDIQSQCKNAAMHSLKEYQANFKGERGEQIVASILGESIAGKQYVLHNLLFKINSNKSCEIDHIYINKFGVWVIETKNYSGSIYGNLQQRNWTQVLAYGAESNQFYNPIKQNASHIYHLSNYLNMKNIFHNIVVFLYADISYIPIDTLYTQDSLHTIKNKATNIQLSAKQMEYIYQKLLELKERNTITKEEHIQNIHREQKVIEYGFCPRCGRQLVVRHSKYGYFYGCPNYPKCTFKKSID